jgi:hypothetical protein
MTAGLDELHTQNVKITQTSFLTQLPPNGRLFSPTGKRLHKEETASRAPVVHAY